MTKGADPTSSPRPGRRPGLRALALAAFVVVCLGVVVIAAFPRDATATGVVLSVEQTGLTNVRGFTLRTPSGEQKVFVVGTLDMRPPAFAPGHLAFHQATGQPVIVTYTTENGTLVARRLVDAPVAP
jgi:hypothetical protein